MGVRLSHGFLHYCCKPATCNNMAFPLVGDAFARDATRGLQNAWPEPLALALVRPILAAAVSTQSPQSAPTHQPKAAVCGALFQRPNFTLEERSAMLDQSHANVARISTVLHYCGKASVSLFYPAQSRGNCQTSVWPGKQPNGSFMDDNMPCIHTCVCVPLNAYLSITAVK